MPYDGHHPIDFSAFEQPAAPAPARRRTRARRAAPVAPQAGPAFGPPPSILPPADLIGAAVRRGQVANPSGAYWIWRIVKFIVLTAIWLAWTLCRLALRPFWHIGESPARPVEAYWSGRRLR